MHASYYKGDPDRTFVGIQQNNNYCLSCMAEFLKKTI